MSSRTFRDRFGSLADAIGDRRPTPVAPPAWPLPPGGRLVEVRGERVTIADQVFAGPDIAAAYQRLLACQAASMPAPLHPAETVFLDTETTGLAGGTGTYVFLVGVGRFVGSAFHVRQLFMRHPGDEAGVLAALEQELQGQNAIVTYNGRSFDVPLLETRGRMHHRALDIPATHLDLLSSARAIWKHRLPNCTLGTIERAVLGTRRDVDAPGWMIPQIYFDYLRTRQTDALVPVFEHNRMDIVSLARLTAIVHGYRTGLEVPSHDIDRLAVALLRLKSGLADDALPELKGLWTRATIPAELRLRALRTLSTELKRRGCYADAVEQWRVGLTDASRNIRLYAVEELAKFLEHVERDHAQALELTRRGVDGASLAGDSAALAAFMRRLERLERKSQRGRPTTSSNTLVDSGSVD